MELGYKDLISLDAATCLYTGMVTDSGSFRYRNTTGHTMRVAADLVDKGVEIDRVHSQGFQHGWAFPDHAPDRGD